MSHLNEKEARAMSTSVQHVRQLSQSEINDLPLADVVQWHDLLDAVHDTTADAALVTLAAVTGCVCCPQLAVASA